MEKYISKKDRIRASLFLSRDRFEVKEQCEAIGCSRTTMYAFLNGCAFQDKWLDKAEQFVRENGYWIWDDHDPKSDFDTANIRPVTHEMLLALAGKLHSVADILQTSDFDIDYRTDELINFIQTIRSALVASRKKDAGQ